MRTIKIISAIALLAVSSCTGSLEGEKGKANPLAKEESEAKKAMSDAACDVINGIDASALPSLAQNLENFSGAIIESDTEDAALEAIIMDLSSKYGTSTEMQSVQNGYYYTYRYLYNYAIKASLNDFHGKFTLETNGKWTVDRSYQNGLIMTVRLPGSKELTADLSWSSETIKVEIMKYSTNYTIQNYNSEHIYNGYIDAEIPRSIKLVFSSGATTLASLDIKADATISGSIMVDNDFNYSLLKTGNFAISGALELGNMKAELSQFNFKNRAPQIGFRLSNKSKCLIDFELSGKDLIISDEAVTIESIALVLNLAEQVQLKGSVDVTDLMALSSVEPAMTEAGMNDYCKKINNHIDLSIYLGSSIRQAYVEVRAFQDEKYNYWFVEPVVVFCNDLSSYGIEEYFSETRFATLLNTLASFIQDLDSLFYPTYR